MSILHYADDPDEAGCFHYMPTGEVWKRLQKMAFQYSEQFPSCTEKEALENCIDGIIEEGWTLPRVSQTNTDTRE